MPDNDAPEGRLPLAAGRDADDLEVVDPDWETLPHWIMTDQIETVDDSLPLMLGLR